MSRCLSMWKNSHLCFIKPYRLQLELAKAAESVKNGVSFDFYTSVFGPRILSTYVQTNLYYWIKQVLPSLSTNKVGPVV
jgi:hypothetical protein